MFSNISKSYWKAFDQDLYNKDGKPNTKTFWNSLTFYSICYVASRICFVFFVLNLSGKQCKMTIFNGLAFASSTLQILFSLLIWLYRLSRWQQSHILNRPENNPRYQTQRNAIGPAHIAAIISIIGNCETCAVCWWTVLHSFPEGVWAWTCALYWIGCGGCIKNDELRLI